MSLKGWLSALALVTAMGAAGTTVAQEHMIGGKAVAADQVDAMKAKCHELRATEDGATSTEAPTPNSDAPAAQPSATTPAAPASPPSKPAPATADAIDLATLTVEICDEEGFTANAR